MNRRITDFLGDTPGRTLIRILVASLIVGIIMSTMGVSPMELWYKFLRFLQHLYDLGFDAIWSLARYFVWGALIVVPVFVIIRLIKFLR